MVTRTCTWYNESTVDDRYCRVLWSLLLPHTSHTRSTSSQITADSPRHNSICRLLHKNLLLLTAFYILQPNNANIINCKYNSLHMSGKNSATILTTWCYFNTLCYYYYYYYARRTRGCIYYMWFMTNICDSWRTFQWAENSIHDITRCPSP